MIKRTKYVNKQHHPIPTGQLKIITHNVNKCRPQSACTSIASAYPKVDVSLFEDNNYRFGISEFPGSEVGRTVILHGMSPLGVQYDVSQSDFHQSVGIPPNTNITTHTSPDCAGTLHDKENKICTINNTIANSSQNTTAVIGTAQPSNSTSARK